MHALVKKITSRRGIVLAAALFTVALAAISSMLMVRTVMDHQRVNFRKRELSRALYAAEAGVAQVIHWGNFSNDYTENPNLFGYTPQAVAMANPSEPQDALASLSGRDLNRLLGLRLNAINNMEGDLYSLASLDFSKADFKLDRPSGLGSQNPAIWTDVPQENKLGGGSLLDLIEKNLSEEMPNTREYEVAVDLPTADAFQLTSGKLDEQYPALYVAMSTHQGNLEINSDMLTRMNAGRLKAKYGYDVSRIRSITLSLPVAQDPAIPGGFAFKVRSVGESPTGLQRNVMSYLNLRKSLSIKIPAAIISLNTASLGGNAAIHWGEAWSMSTFTMPSASQMNYMDESHGSFDKWVKYRSQGTISFPSSWKFGTSPSSKDLYSASAPQPGLFPGPVATNGRFSEGFFQNVPPGVLVWPDFLHDSRTAKDNNVYREFKDYAIKHDSYYSTDASGNIYKNGIETAANKIDFLSHFGTPNRDATPYEYAFIDTVDGNPPNATNSNVATISASGNSLGLKGFFYMCVNFDAGGVGSPPAVTTADNPDGTGFTLQKIFLDGAMFSAGWTTLSGNAGIYGAVMAEKGLKGGGTPDIYYNAKLADGLDITRGNVGSRFMVLQEFQY